MFWNKKPKIKTMEDVVRRALDAGVSASGFHRLDPFRWAVPGEDIEARLAKLTDLAIYYRKEAREYPILYSGGPVVQLNWKLDQFLADESFKKNLVKDVTSREVEVQRSLAMVEAVRAGKDSHPGFLKLVEAETLGDIKTAQNMLASSDMYADIRRYNERNAS